MHQTIRWKLCLKSKPSKVFSYLTSTEGIEKFWAEKAEKKDGHIQFSFPNKQVYKSKILNQEANKNFRIEYFNSIVDFNLSENELGGTLMELVNSNVELEDYHANYAGWVSVLMTLKAAVDFEVDLRNHDSQKTWDDGYMDN
ncbi:SRPBCC domain-containing protein [Allomuricauda sp. SCSIO 65647]|uniref:SRPBCC family protein n=1 Tax=Allomuricauda sp. SCSIO 65647 TaxID=2908843 RepID=UPI001F3FFBDC|nr:SRPBCC domain-containing protein [Muricauda sp. SCSIO 65647]UJH68631.1 SRPBCC domain-containing protein [Muricauda sp. SCSIO 65647]